MGMLPQKYLVGRSAQEGLTSRPAAEALRETSSDEGFRNDHDTARAIKRNARQQDTSDFRGPCRWCAQSSSAVVAKLPGFQGEFRKGDGLKNRRLGQCKMSIG
jgi:hypothetical protein